MAPAKPAAWLVIKPTPVCTRCGGSTRLVSYRRNGGSPTWTCATCAGYGVDARRGSAVR